MSEVKAISFGFENCESVEIPIEYVYQFSLDDITSLKTWYNYHGAKDYKVINKLYILFDKSFDGYTGKTDYDEFVIDRICKYNDICWFGIIYENGIKEDYMVKWQGQDNYNNASQKSTRQEYGLEIEVGYE